MCVDPNEKMQDRVAALLELTGQGQTYADNPLAVTLRYVQNLNSTSFPIFDTQSSVQRLRDLLQSLYDQGYRIFIGFTDCGVNDQIMPWLLAHRDCLAISLYSSCIITEIVGKNMIRLNPSNRYQSFFMAKFIQRRRYNTILYVVETYTPASTEFVDGINEYLMDSDIPIDKVSLYLRDITTDFTSNRVIENVVNTLINGGTNMVMINLTFGDTTNLLDTLNNLMASRDEVTVPFDIMDPNNLDVILTPQQSTLVANRYYHFQLDQTPDTSNIEIATILGDDFSYNVYDAFNVARLASSDLSSIANGQIYDQVSHLLGHNGSLELNEFHDKRYGNFKVILWNGVQWTSIIRQGNDPSSGIFISYVTFLQMQV